MSIGKYSPICPHANDPGRDAFKFNCYGEAPAEWNKELKNLGLEYDQKTMFDGYDSEGFDSYGYSAFDLNGNYIGIGNGIDRAGHTEDDYSMASIRGEELFENTYSSHSKKTFLRKK